MLPLIPQQSQNYWNGLWWWSNGQHPRLLLWQSEFESSWLQKFSVEKMQISEKEAGISPSKKKTTEKWPEKVKSLKLGLKVYESMLTGHPQGSLDLTKLWTKGTWTNLFVVLSSDCRQLGGAVLTDVLQVLDLGVVVVPDSLHLRGAIRSDPVGLRVREKRWQNPSVRSRSVDFAHCRF